MNKQFFKIKNTIKLSDVLKILDVSKEDFFSIKSNVAISLENINIEDFVSFENLEKNKLSFFTNTRNNLKYISSGVCIVNRENSNLLHKNIIKIPFKNPKNGFSKILKTYFQKEQKNYRNSQIHPSSTIHSTAKIGKNVFIGAYSVINEGVIIDDDVYISERVTISTNCIIGKKCFIGVGVSIECTVLSQKVTISHNTILGKIGFGFIPNKSKTCLTPHIGGLVIGKGTNIGSCCTIDRGLIDNTSVGKYVMIDNQVHIGHNCIIDDFCILAGKVGLSGSVILEENVVLGGDVSIKDNVRIGKNSIVAGASKIFSNFPKDSRIGGSPAMDISSWKRLIAAQRLNYIKRKKN